MELIKRIGCRGTRYSYGLFKCPYCKDEVEKQLSHGKKAMSCGCARIELMKETLTIHGDSSMSSKYHRLYQVWLDMSHRCYDDENKQ